MKIRNGFVSNSSSSSFIVIEPLTGPIHVGKCFVDDENRLVVDRHTGYGEFGWEYETHHDFGSKLIFAFCQADYMLHPIYKSDVTQETGKKWMDMLEKVVKDVLNVKEIIWNITTTTKYGEETEGRDRVYIDHQSASYEGENTEMFENEQTLKNFLFNPNSYIQTDNDNH